VTSSQPDTQVLPDLEPTDGYGAASRIARIDLYSYDLSYVGGEYVMSGGRVVTTLESTVVKVTTSEGVTGYGETCPLGSNYLPAHASGARAALVELAPHLVGLDAANPVAIARAADRVLLGHG
jgi:L-alanine-DL-glutamate epimerase-like enolase superfamily enzyme